jgi:RNA polymerase sigma-70 factor (ECF subfamily)
VESYGIYSLRIGQTFRSNVQIRRKLNILTAPAFTLSNINSSSETPARGPIQRSSQSVDVQLASLASAGDDSAFTTLVTRFHPLVFRWALTFARDADEAEDITQEAFVVAHQQLSNYRSDGSIEAWLYSITRRTAGQMRRTTKRRSRLAQSPLAGLDRDVYTTDPGGRVDRERVGALIRDMFENLPLRQREIFDLVDLQGLSPGEAAERTGLKPVSVRASLFKARQAIRKAILVTHPAFAELK